MSWKKSITKSCTQAESDFFCAAISIGLPHPLANLDQESVGFGLIYCAGGKAAVKRFGLTQKAKQAL